MKEKYWITQDYTCTTNTYNGYIKTKLKSVVVVVFFSLRELAMIPCSELIIINNNSIYLYSA